LYQTRGHSTIFAFYRKAAKTGELIMKNLVRGGVVLSLIGMFVVFIYAQTETRTSLNIADESQIKLNSQIKLVSNIKDTGSAVQNKKPEAAAVTTTANDPEDKKLVKKTVSSKAISGRSRSFTATAYCLKGRTAMGHSVRRGLIAADPRVLKLGSKVNLGAGAYSGDYLVSDTGGRIKGNKIDIWMASCSEARRFGRRTITVTQ
jgi:3D (Asp-Asp-Asp) domain-containing protein